MWRSAAIPVAILLGCGMIAAAIYLGLTHRPSDVPSHAPVAEVSPPEPLGVVLPRVRAEAEAGLEGQRAAMVSACLGDAGLVPLTFSLSFDAQGREIMRGISLAGTGKDAAAQCLRDRFPPSLHVAAPRMNVSVEVPFQLQ
jgi:hypothetical protein